MENLSNNGLEVIESLRKAGKKNDIVYAYAFGMAWAYLTDEARIQILKLVEKMANEKGGE